MAMKGTFDSEIKAALGGNKQAVPKPQKRPGNQMSATAANQQQEAPEDAEAVDDGSAPKPPKKKGFPAKPAVAKFKK